MPPAILLILCVISCMTGMSVLAWPAKSLDLNPIEHVWDLLDRRVRARAIPPRNVRELAGAFMEEWGNISQQELANLVQSMRRRCTAVLNAACGHTRYWLLLVILTPLCSGRPYSISVSHMSVELVQFMSQLLNLVMFIQIFTHVKFAENKRSWQWEDVSFFAEFVRKLVLSVLTHSFFCTNHISGLSWQIWMVIFVIIVT